AGSQPQLTGRVGEIPQPDEISGKLARKSRRLLELARFLADHVFRHYSGMKAPSCMVVRVGTRHLNETPHAQPLPPLRPSPHPNMWTTYYDDRPIENVRLGIPDVRYMWVIALGCVDAYGVLTQKPGSR